MEDLDDFLARYHEALDAFTRGDHEPAGALWSDRDDITLGNPFGPFVRGMPQIEDAMKRAASNYRDGHAVGFDEVARYAAEDLVVLVEVERLEAKVGGAEDLASLGLRVTSVLSRESGRW